MSHGNENNWTIIYASDLLQSLDINIFFSLCIHLHVTILSIVAFNLLYKETICCINILNNTEDFLFAIHHIDLTRMLSLSLSHIRYYLIMFREWCIKYNPSCVSWSIMCWKKSYSYFWEIYWTALNIRLYRNPHIDTNTHTRT